ncbi:MAG: hypothetical protein LBH52_03765 [Puniceicoccales bacterium]|jgi:hypothetical protein|nr:hypothetical protein [Puniceicoccales bacterium]
MKNNVKLQTRSSSQQQEARKKLIELYKNTPLPVEQLMVNLPLYIRSSALAKLLYINELYELIIKTPGIIMEFGAWWGCNMVLFENLRNVYEPYNWARKVVGFDTFEGYSCPTEQDGREGELAFKNNYSVCENYAEHLSALLDYMQEENVLSHIKKYELVKGDATKTIHTYLDNNPQTIIALAYFDMQLYSPTKACLKAIQPYLTKGSVIAMDELNHFEFPGETIAYKEVFELDKYKIIRSKYLPDRSYIVIE